MGHKSTPYRSIIENLFSSSELLLFLNSFRIYHFSLRKHIRTRFSVNEINTITRFNYFDVTLIQLQKQKRKGLLNSDILEQNFLQRGSPPFSYNVIGSPPPIGSRKNVLKFRSNNNIVIAPANTGKDNKINKITVKIKRNYSDRNISSDVAKHSFLENLSLRSTGWAKKKSFFLIRHQNATKD